MKLSLPLLLFGLLLSPMGASELARVVVPLKEPSIESARVVLEDLDRLVAQGDARTVTLGKKMHRSVKRLFTREAIILAARKAADDREIKAKQFDRNGREWLKPNIHGRNNKNAAAAAFRDARELRQETERAHAGLSRDWREEVADFERMLGDLQFSGEEEALLTLAELLSSVVARMPWVVRPELKYDQNRIQFIKDRNSNLDRWMTLAKAAAEAGDFELSYDFYRRAGADLGKFAVGARLASRLEQEGFTGSAINLWERLGEKDRASGLKTRFPVLKSGDYKPLKEGELARNVAPACVRVLIPGGHRTGFFVRQGGFLLTCRDGLLDEDGTPRQPRVVLEDGRKLAATLIASSQGHDLAILKVDHSAHELIPLGDREDLKPGLGVTLFGFPEIALNVAAPTKGTVMSEVEVWNEQPTIRLAMDGSRGQIGGPLVDQRGRVLGIFLTSKTGTARSLEVGAIIDFLRKL